jgi:hypothetical protein
MTTPARHEALLLEQHRKLSLHYLSGHGLDWYAQVISRPLFYLISLNFAFYLVGGLPNMGGTYDAIFLPLIFLVEIVVFAWLGWKVAWQMSWKTLPRGMKFFSCSFAGALLGMGLGIAMTIFKVFWFRELWTITNIITEGPIRMIEGLVIATLSGAITLLVVRNHQRQGKY